MKKISKVLILSFILTFFAGCGSKVKTGVFFLKYYDASNMNNNALELYNSSNKKEDLSKYSIYIYPNGDQLPEYMIDLQGIIEPGGHYLVANTSVSDEGLALKADLKTPHLLYNGNDTIVLMKNGKPYDSLGMLGNSVDFAKYTTLIRKDNYFYPMKDYSEYAYIFYKHDAFEYLKNLNHPLKNNKDLIDGPKLNNADFDLPFVDPNNSALGGGGVKEVSLYSIQDGDTATFKDTEGNEYRVRFAYIDTKEVQGTGSPTGQEWGYPASRFTKGILNQASTYHIQTIKGDSLIDQYNRYLGLVWADGELVNFLVTRAGLSDFSDSNRTLKQNEMHYKNIPYHAFIANSVARAKENKWGLFGEKDLLWDYDNNRPFSNHGSIIFNVSKREYDPKLDK